LYFFVTPDLVKQLSMSVCVRICLCLSTFDPFQALIKLPQIVLLLFSIFITFSQISLEAIHASIFRDGPNIVCTPFPILKKSSQIAPLL
jgi:hypothetical protein